MKELPTIEYLRQCLDYDPDTGAIYWTKKRPRSHFKTNQSFNSWHTIHAGALIDSKDSFGYLRLNLRGKLIKAHRAAYALYYGQWPEGEIDHIDGNRSNNSIYNLRVVTHHENGKNQRIPKHNSSGFVGVCWHKKASKWRAQVVINDRQIHLGLFDSMLDAVAARKRAEKNHNFHFNHGRAAT